MSYELFKPQITHPSTYEATALYVCIDTKWVNGFAASSREAGATKAVECQFDIDGRSYELSASLLAEILAPYEVKNAAN